MNTDFKNIKVKALFIGFCLIVWAMGSVSLASAAPAENVSLATFNSTDASNGVLLSWTTATELDTFGFRIERELNGDLVLFPSDGDVIQAVGGPTLGASYEFLDETAVSPHTYTYHLIEQTLSGSLEEISSTTITLIDTTQQVQLVAPPTDVPRATNTLQPTNTAVSATPTNTNAPEPTATESIPTATNTLQSPPNPQPPISNLQSPTPTKQQIALVNTDVETEPAQEEPAAPPLQTTPEDSYPAPPTPLPVAEEAYPEGAEAPPTPLPPTAYPEGFVTNTPPPQPTIAVIGETDGETSDTELVVAESENSTSGRIYLWGGFLMGILIFVTAVIGAIILFTRRNG